MNDFYIAKSLGKGKGVFAGRAFKEDETIGKAHVIPLLGVETQAIQETVLENYLFDWGVRKPSAIALSELSFLNHDYKPNANYIHEMRKKCIVVKAIRNIQKDEEITVNYNGDPDNDAPGWFDD